MTIDDAGNVEAYRKFCEQRERREMRRIAWQRMWGEETSGQSYEGWLEDRLDFANTALEAAEAESKRLSAQIEVLSDPKRLSKSFSAFCASQASDTNAMRGE